MGPYMTTIFSRALPFLMSFGVSNALTQSDFVGLYGQIATGYESNYLNSLNGTTIHTPNVNHNTIITAPNQSWGGAPLVLGIGYYLKAHEKLLLGLGADYSALSKTSSNWGGAYTNEPGNFLIKPGDTVTSSGLSMKLSNRFNVFFSPAYVIDKEKLLYLKFGYSQVSTQYNRATTVTSTNLSRQSIITPATGGYQISNQPGYILGLGYRQIITGGFYGFGEGEYMGYKAPSYSFTSVKPAETVQGVITNSTQKTTYRSSSGLNAYQLLVGLGYAF